MRVEHPVWQDCPALQRIYRLLKGKARFVGGCVRDCLVGKVPLDIDMATEFKPAAVTGILKAHGLTVLPTGYLFGTVTVLTGDDSFPTVEVTSLRQDINTDGRRPKVVYTKDWETDAVRRDFTFNALYADWDGNVTDYTSGLEDLRNGYVRFIGNADERIKEDYLRILRYFRFLALFDRSAFDDDTLAACCRAKDNLARISLDRTKREVFKLLTAAHAGRGLAAMTQSDITGMYFPALDLQRMERFLALYPAAGLNSRLLMTGEVSLAGVEALVAKWQLSKAVRKELRHIVAYDRTKPPAEYDERDLFRYAVHFEKSDKAEIAALFAAANRDDAWLTVGEQAQKITLPPFRFSGADALSLVDSDKKIVPLLNQVRKYWMSVCGRAERKELLAFAEKAVKSSPNLVQSNPRNG